MEQILHSHASTTEKGASKDTNYSGITFSYNLQLTHRPLQVMLNEMVKQEEELL